MASIWDFDVVIWAVSQVRAAKQRGQHPRRKIRFQAYDMLRSIGRDTGGTDYKQLEAALNRLAGTLVETNIRAPAGQRKETFHLLDAWKHVTDGAGCSKHMTLALPDWLFRGALDDRDVLRVSPNYFGIPSGLGRWIYRLARRHGGNQEPGWRFRMEELHARSGSTQPLNQFARDLRKIMAKGVPEYALTVVRGQTGEEAVHMVRNPDKTELPQRRDFARIELPRCGSHRGITHRNDGASPTGRHGVSPTKARGITHRKRR
jgi:plasmid replication initiation protein